MQTIIIIIVVQVTPSLNCTVLPLPGPKMGKYCETDFIIKILLLFFLPGIDNTVGYTKAALLSEGCVHRRPRAAVLLPHAEKEAPVNPNLWNQ